MQHLARRYTGTGIQTQLCWDILIPCERQNRLLILGQSQRVGWKIFPGVFVLHQPLSQAQGTWRKGQKGASLGSHWKKRQRRGTYYSAALFQTAQSDMTPAFCCVALGPGHHRGQLRPGVGHEEKDKGIKFKSKGNVSSRNNI